MTGPSGARRRSVADVLLGAMVLMTAIVGLHLMGRGALAAPPSGSIDRVKDWAALRDPVTIGLVVVRLAALGLAYHLAATSALALVGRMARRPGLVRLAQVSTPPPLRGALRRTLGLTLSLTAAATGPLPPSVGPARPTVVAAGSAHATPGSVLPEGSDPDAPMVLRHLAPDGTGAGTTASLRLVGDEARGPAAPVGRATLRRVDRPRPAPPEPAQVPGRHLVRPGDHLWSIAETSLTQALGRRPSDREVAPYWRSVVAANPQLTDPDLLHPGHHVTIPPPPGRRAGPPAAPPTPGGSATLRPLRPS